MLGNAFFFFGKENVIQSSTRKGITIEKSKRSSKASRAYGGSGESKEWGSRGVVPSFPDLSNTGKFSKLGELMGCSIMIPFQMMEAPAAEI